ncbi:MAG TPA: class I SAM-dependent methyltransferase [Bosea sp. (in: a-proteobacteria)]
MSDDAILSSDEHRVATVEALWGGAPPTEEADQWSTYPLSHPVVKAAMNGRATGNPRQNAYFRLLEQLKEWGFSLPLQRVASLCCGAGAVERQLAEMGLIESCIGLDIAPGALDAARQAAADSGYSGLTYERRDLERDGLGLSNLDLVFAHQGVHHISQLERVFDSVYESLNPGGVFHLDEFVGPDRFQWPDRQVQEMTDWLQSLPKRYQITRGGLVKACAGRATIAEMIAYDPSEAVRSSEIERLVGERFEIVERRALGGTLTMMALADIGQNFNPNVPEDAAHIQRLLDREAELIATGEIGSDFAVIVARKPS